MNKKLLELAPFMPIILIVYSYLYYESLYRPFGVDIYSYLSLEEIILLFLPVLYELCYEIFYELLVFFITLIIIVFIFYYNVLLRMTKLNKSGSVYQIVNPASCTFLVLAFLAILFTKYGSYKADNIKKGELNFRKALIYYRTANPTQVFTSEKGYSFIGETEKYLFLYSQNDFSTQIVKRESIDSISIKEDTAKHL